MKRIALFTFIGLAAVFALTSCQEQRLTEDEVIALLDTLENKLDWLNYRLTEESWRRHTTTDRPDSLEYYRGLYAYVTSDESALKNLRDAGVVLKDEVDKRRRDLIYAALVRSHVENHPPIAALRDSLAELLADFRAEFESGVYTASYLAKIFRNDDDPTRREQAYRAWCARGEAVSPGLGRLLRLRNQRARMLGYNNFLGMTFKLQGLNEADYLNLLKRLDSLSSQPYQQLLGRLKRKLGKETIEIWDIDYVYKGVNAEIDRYFPADSQMAFLKRSLKPLGFNLDKLPIYFVFAAGQPASPTAVVFPVKPPDDIRMLVRLSDGLSGMQTLLREVGRAVHYAHIVQDHPLFADTLPTCWSGGVARVIASLCEEKSWLTEYAHVPLQLVDRYLAAKREQDLIALRVTLLRLYFEYEAYANPNRNLNDLYWDLFERILSMPRHDELQPWAAETDLIIIPAGRHNFLSADLVTAQTIDFLKETYAPLFANPAVGAFLIQNYYRFGSRYDWRELLERGTGEKLNPDHLVDKLGL
jgi:peptidyl-dipeptidase A